MTTEQNSADNQRRITEICPKVKNLFEEHPNLIPRTALRDLFVPNSNAVVRGVISADAQPQKFAFSHAIAKPYAEWVNELKNPDLDRLRPGSNGQILLTHDEVEDLLFHILNNNRRIRYVLDIPNPDLLNKT